MKTLIILKTSIVCLIILTLSSTAFAEIILYDKEETTFSVDGSFNTFYVYSDSDNELTDSDHQQSRVKMGFLPNWIGFNFSKIVDGLKLGGRSSFWVTINDSDNNLTETGIDVRQFYGTVDADWGQILIGKDFTLFCRSNIFNDEILLGYGNVSDTLGLIDGNGVSFGNIGSGYLYPFPSAQITYRTPDFNGFKLAIGIIDPSKTSADGQEEIPRFEGELTYNHEFGDISLSSWAGLLYQTSDSDTSVDTESKGVSYGLRVKYADFSVAASGFTGEELGFLLGPGPDTTLSLPVGDTDSDGYLVQGSYTYNKARFAISYGKNKLDDDNGPDWEDETITGACFYSINTNLKLVAEYNINTLTIGNDDEETKTIALGAIINF